MPHRHQTLSLPVLLAALLLPACGESKQTPEPTRTQTQGDTGTTTSGVTSRADEADNHTAPLAEAESTPPDPLRGGPERFTDAAPQYVQRENVDGDTVAVETDPVPFDMIRVPGDAARGIEPFYMGETEVTWAMLESWMYCRDLVDIEEIQRLIAEGLRPSPLYDFSAIELRIWEDDPLPAVTLTRTTAEAFCLWLSEKTGRTYRLPTPEEFALALRLGGGCPDDTEALLTLGGFRENSRYEDEFFGPLDPDDPMYDELVRTVAVKSYVPNALGLYDLLGNAAEWVVAPGGPAYLMGGHFAVPAAEMSADWTDTEDHQVWNEGYPNYPPSWFWYWGRHHFQGFRLVCEARP